MFLNVRKLEFSDSQTYIDMPKLSENTQFGTALLLRVFSAFGKLRQIDFRSDFRSKNDFFRNFFPDLKSVMKTTYTHIQFILNISVVWKIKIPTWLSLIIQYKNFTYVSSCLYGGIFLSIWSNKTRIGRNTPMTQ